MSDSMERLNPDKGLSRHVNMSSCETPRFGGWTAVKITRMCTDGKHDEEQD